MAPYVNAEVGQQLEELLAGHAQLSREIMDARTGHYILLRVLRSDAGLKTSRQSGVPHPDSLHRLTPQHPAKVAGRGACEQDHTSCPGEPAHLLLRARAAIPRDDHQGQLVALQRRPHATGPHHYMTGLQPEAE